MKCACKSASKVIIQEIMYFMLELSAQKMKSFMLTSQISWLIGKDSQHQGPYSDGAQMNGIQPEEISRLREEIEELKSIFQERKDRIFFQFDKEYLQKFFINITLTDAMLTVFLQLRIGHVDPFSVFLLNIVLEILASTIVTIKT